MTLCFATCGIVDKDLFQASLRNKINDDQLEVVNITYCCDAKGCNKKSKIYDKNLQPSQCNVCGLKFDLCIDCSDRYLDEINKESDVHNFHKSSSLNLVPS